jgi:hypothetical protein
LTDFSKAVSDARAWSAGQFDAEIALVNRGLELYLEQFQHFVGTKVPEDHQKARILLATRAFSSIQAAHEVLQSGFPLQSIMLARSAHEDTATALYLERHPEDAHFWNDPTYGEPGRWREIPNMAKVHKGLVEPIKGRFLEMYDVLSEVHHPRPLVLRHGRDVVKLGQRSFRMGQHNIDTTTVLRVGPRQDDWLSRFGYYLLIQVTVQAVGILWSRIAANNS